MTHISVVKSMKRVGDIGSKKGFDGRLPVPADPKIAAGLPNARIVVFIQERGQGRVLGSAEINVRQSAGMVARWSPQK